MSYDTLSGMLRNPKKMLEQMGNQLRRHNGGRTNFTAGRPPVSDISSEDRKRPAAANAEVEAEKARAVTSGGLSNSWGASSAIVDPEMLQAYQQALNLQAIAQANQATRAAIAAESERIKRQSASWVRFMEGSMPSNSPSDPVAKPKPKPAPVVAPSAVSGRKFRFEME